MTDGFVDPYSNFFPLYSKIKFRTYPKVTTDFLTLPHVDQGAHEIVYFSRIFRSLSTTSL